MANDKTALGVALDQLAAKIDELEHRARIYDSAFGFFKLNYPDQAPLLEAAMMMAEDLPEIQNAHSSAHGSLRQEALELFSRVLQEISNLGTAEHEPSKNR